MKLRFWQFVMSFAWTVETYAKEFTNWTRQKYSDELFGMGMID